MHPINKVLSVFDLNLVRTTGKAPKGFVLEYNRCLNALKENCRGFKIFRGYRYDAGAHPANYIDHECAFAVAHLKRLKPKKILDIGSYRHFIIGLLAYYEVTTLDVREREPVNDNEIVIVTDAKDINLPDNSFDVVLSLCSLEHFGLGRYGDEFDLDADRKAFSEMVRVLKPNGRLIFSTLITSGAPAIVFNAHRIYDINMIRQFCNAMKCEEEKFYSQKLEKFCAFSDVTSQPGGFDIYCGCWKKE